MYCKTSFTSCVRAVCTVLTCALTLIAPAPASAQTSTGVLFGTVRDAGGAVMPGVTVMVIDAGTNARNETVTDERGTFIDRAIAARDLPRGSGHARLQELHPEQRSARGPAAVPA